MTLYELNEEYRQFLDAMERGEIPEEAIEDTLGALQGEIRQKRDNIACIVKQLRAEALALDAEEKALAERKKSKRARADRLEQYLAADLLNAGERRFETERNVVTFRRSERVQFPDEGGFCEWAKTARPDLLTYTEPKPNKTAIKDALKLGDDLQGLASVVETQNISIK